MIALTAPDRANTAPRALRELQRPRAGLPPKSHRSDSQRRLSVLLVGPMAPAIGGMATVIRQWVDGPLASTVDFQVHAANARNHRRRSLLPSIIHHLRRLGTLWRTLRPRTFDVVHIHTCSGFTFYRNLADAALSGLFGAAVILHIHGGRFEEFCDRATPPGRWIIRKGLTRAHRVVVLSDAWRQRLSPFAPQARFLVVPNAVPVHDPPRTASAHHPDSTCRFVFLGPMTRAKGVDLLLQASAEMVRRGLRFHLTLAGPIQPGPQALDLSAEIESQALQGHVDYVGTVTGSAKSALLARSHCLVLPSLAEGMPISILEAGAAGLAVIATDVGAVRELLGHDSPPYVVPPGDITALIDSMTRLAIQPNLAFLAGAQLRQRVRSHYSLTRQAQLLTSLYQDLAPIGGPRP